MRDLVADHGHPAELAHDEAGRRSRSRRLGHPDAGALEQLVGSQRGAKMSEPPSRTMPARVRSCSSATSPTSSSTRSSRVTTPAVPPYSSTTTAIWKPPPAQQPEQRVEPMVSRHPQRLDHQRPPARDAARSAAATAKACLTWTTPTMSSESSPITGKRE